MDILRKKELKQVLKKVLNKVRSLKKVLKQVNKAKAISADLLVFIKLGSCYILVLGTFKFW